MKAAGTISKKLSIVIWLLLASLITYTLLYTTKQSWDTIVNNSTNEVSGVNNNQIEDLLASSMFTELARTQINENQRNIKGTYQDNMWKETAITLIIILDTQRRIESIISNDSGIQDQINNFLKGDNRRIQEIVMKIIEIEKQRDETRCNELSWETTITLTYCGLDQIDLKKNDIEYHIKISQNTIHDISSSDQELTPILQQKFTNIEIQQNNIKERIKEITEEQGNKTKPEDTWYSQQNQTWEWQSLSIQEIFKNKLAVDIQSVSQKEDQALVTFQLSWIVFTANYQIQTQQIKWLFIDSVKIDEKPLLIRTFVLSFKESDENDRNSFQTNPLQFIKTFYPKIEEVFEKYHK